mmetsp:Transcript_27713/g.45457  ORF Transcript_27713/g.45457 Transcript_27713/m.45457 type:complete len:217 (-) Transcript_27713:1255-1905(-)
MGAVSYILSNGMQRWLSRLSPNTLTITDQFRICLSSCCFFTAVIMNIFHVYTLLAIFVLQMGVALAEESDALPWSGKPNTKANRKNSRGGSSTDHSHHSHHTHHTHHTHHSKSSKSTDSPTLFPTLAPSMSPTYCGKATKSWWNSDRRLSSKSESCHSGSRSAKERKRKLADKRKLVDLGHEKPDEDAEFELDDMKVRRRRRINSDNREHVDEMKP